MEGDDRASGGTGADARIVSHSAWLAPVLVVYYLCCWPQDAESDTSSERHTTRRGTFGHDSGSHHRASDFFSRRMGSSAVSLHLPSTSGQQKEQLSAHRSHEEIRRRKSHHETREDSTRYHSAPSVIDEVLHRRDWERSTRELHIPLRPDDEALSVSSGSPEAPRAEPESSSLEDRKSDEQVFNLRIVGHVCKKHHTNIKSTKVRKERQADDDKDCDATENPNFYIGDNERFTSVTNSPRNEASSVTTSPRYEGTSSVANSSFTNSPRRDDLHTKSIYRAKDAKQTFNESIRSKERPKQTLVPLEEHQPGTFGFYLDDVIEQLETLDRSGATHHSIESRISLSKPPFPPPSVEAVGYEGGACYLPARGRRSPREPPAPTPAGLRARHASDGDILAPAHRPESGAFSESDLDLELDVDLEEGDHPPPYDELLQYSPDTASPPRPRPRQRPACDRRETAI